MSRYENSDRPSIPRHFKLRLSRTLTAARRKGYAIRLIFDSSKTDPDNILYLLSSGWPLLQSAVGQIIEFRKGQLPPELLRSLTRAGLLSHNRAFGASDVEKLRGARASLSETNGSSLSCREYKSLITRYEKALQILERWSKRNLRSLAGRVFRTALMFFLFFLFAGMTALAAVGIFKSLTLPAPDWGLSAAYYTKLHFKGHPFRRLDHQIDFEWGNMHIFRGLPRDKFSVHWRGCLLVDKPRYLVVEGDDQISLYLNDELIAEANARQKPRLIFSKNRILPGTYRIQIDFFDRVGLARAFFGWSTKLSKAETEAVPAEYLVPVGGNKKSPCIWPPEQKDKQQPPKVQENNNPSPR